MKYCFDRWSKWVKGAMALLLVLSVLMAGGALAEEPEETAPNKGDGSEIEWLKLDWVTADSELDNYEKPAPVTDKGLLYHATKEDSELNLKFQFEVALSGQNDYAPGTIQIRFPAQILHARKYEDRGGKTVGVADPDALLGKIDLSVPAAPSVMADFNWQLIRGEYVLTNTRTLGATSKAMFQASITGVRPHDLVDMSISDPLAVTCDVVTELGNVLTLTSEPLTAQIDTFAAVKEAHKSTDDDLYEECPENLPEELLLNLPEGANPDDYIYVRWYSYVYHEGNQPFSLKIADRLSTACELVVDENGNETEKYVTDGIFLGSTNYDGTILTNGDYDFEADVLTNTFHETTTHRLDHTVYMWSAYKKSDFRVPFINEPQITYVMKNETDWILTPADEQDSATITTAHSETSITYMPVRWGASNGYFDVFKYTGYSNRRDITYGYTLNRLANGEPVSIPFRLVTVGFGYPWTAQEADNGELGKEAYGKLGWKQVTRDFQTFFNGSNVPLNWQDYEISSIQIAKPQRFAYDKVKKPTQGYFNDDDGLAFGTIPGGQLGYFADTSLPVPDLHVEYMLKDDGVWRHAATATWGEDGKGGMRFVNVAEGITASAGGAVFFPANTTDVRHSFTSNVFNGVTAETCDIAGLIWNAYPSIKLKPSDKIVAVVDDLFASSDTPSTKFKNDVAMDVSVWVPANGEGTLLTADPMYDISRATLSGASYGVTMSKAVDFDPKSTYEDGDNDVAKRRIVLHYSATVHEQTNLDNLRDYYDAQAEGVIPRETEGVWYDLLPPGAAPLMDTIRLREGDSITHAYTVPNHRESGRTLLVVEAKLQPTPEMVNGGYADEPELFFDAVYSWEDMDKLGGELTNYIAFESKTPGLKGGTLGSIQNEKGEPDDPRGGCNVTTPKMPDDVAALLKDLDRGTDDNRFLYATTKLNANVNIAAVSGMSKTVASDADGLYTQGIPGMDQTSVYEGQGYTYRLRVISSHNTTTKDIVIYDSIENYKLPANDPSKQEDWNDQQQKQGWQGEWQNTAQWRGTLEKVDAGEFVRMGAAPVVYYSAVPGLAFKDAGSGLSQDGTLDVFNQGEYDLANTAIWRKAELTADGVWVVPENVKGKVSAVAVDVCKTADGKSFVLEAGKAAAAYLHMTAPTDQGDPGKWSAKGAYAHKTNDQGQPIQDIDWEKALDPANNLYAYNNVRLKCVQTSTEFSGESSNVVIRNDYTRIGILPGVFEVRKTWKDQNNHDNIRPGEVTVTLMRKAADSVEDPTPVLDASGQPLTVVLSEQNNWTALFTQVDLQDENGVPYLYTFEENEVPGYTLTINPLDKNHFELINRHPNEPLEISGVKQWDDNDNALNLRPASVTVYLYRDGELFKTTTAQPDAIGNWSYSFGKVDKYAEGGREYEYTIKEKYVPKYASEAEGWSLLTNRYEPFGDLCVTKHLEGATEAAAAKNEFTFTLTFMQELGPDQTEPVPLMGSYDYQRQQLAADGQTWTTIETGKITSGGTLVLKGGERAVVSKLPSDSTYRIEEASRPGFVLSEKVNDTGSILAGQMVEAEFTNTYITRGTVQLAATKHLTGQPMRTNAFEFELWNVTDETAPVLCGTTYSGVATSSREGGLGQPITSQSEVYFGQLEYSAADDGKTYRYRINEVDANRGGYTYDQEPYFVIVKVRDDGDGTMTVEAVRENSEADPTVPENMVFENTYEAKGEATLRAWKRLKKRDLKADEFTFELYPFDPAENKITGEAVRTATNDAEGNVVFAALTFDQDDLSEDLRNPAVYSYLMREAPGTDETVIYDTETLYLFHLTLHDNLNGTISFGQEMQKATLNVPEGSELADLFEPGAVLPITPEATEEAPLFVNDLEDGALTVTKRVNGKNPNAEQKFKFHVRFTGEDLPESIKYTVGDDSTSSSTTPLPDSYFHATEEQLKGEAYAVLDKTTGTLTFFRSEGTTDHLGRVFIVDGSISTGNGNLVYYKIDETAEPDVEDKTLTEDHYQQIYKWPWFNELSSIKHVTMEGALRPVTTVGFLQHAASLETADLSLLDTSNSDSMAGMFQGCGNLKNVDVSHFDTGKVVYMSQMFADCNMSNIDISAFNMNSVTHTNGMFDCVSADRIVLPDSDAPKLWHAEAMFARCATEYLDLSNFHFSGMKTMGYCFDGANVQIVKFPNVELPEMQFAHKLFHGASNLIEVDMGYFNVPKPDAKEDQAQGVHWGIQHMIADCDNLASLDISSLNTSEFDSITIPGPVFTGTKNLYELTISNHTKLREGDIEGSLKSANWTNITGQGAVLTTTELLTQGNHGGTWVRTGVQTYTINFVSNEGAGEAQSKIWAVERAAALDVPNFVKLDHVLTGFKDDHGNFYAANNGKVIIPAKTGSANGTLTLTAQWEKISHEATLEEGVVSFELMEDQTATFPNLPASISYEVWEETPAGWVLVNASNESGVIQPLHTSKATFVNQWSPEAAKVQLRALKLLDGVAAEKDMFQFQLRKITECKDGQYGSSVEEIIETVSNRAGGAVVFQELSFDSNDVGTTFIYYIEEVKPDTDDGPISYATESYKVEVKITSEYINNQNVIVADVTYMDLADNELSTPPVFQNTTKPGYLTIEKNVTGGTNATANQEFNIRIAFTDEDRQPWSGRVKLDGVEKDIPATGVYTLEVEADNEHTFSGLPAGVRYEVREEGSLPGWTMDTTVHSGQITANKGETVTFNNTYSTKGTAIIEVIKKLEGRTPEDGEFTFQLMDEHYTNLIATASNALTSVLVNPDAPEGEAPVFENRHVARFPEQTFTKEGTYCYVICEVIGNDEFVTYSQEKIYAVVTATDNGQGRLITKVTYTDGNNNPLSNVITNTMKTGDLRLSKTTVNAGEAHREQAFVFTIYLTDAHNQLVNGEYSLSTGGTLKVENGAGTLTLKGGETVTVSGLPHGANYSIVEEAVKGFRQSSTGATGKIEKDAVAQVSFINTYSAQGSYAFAAHKTLQGADLKEGQFLFELRDEEGSTLATASNAADGSVTFGELHFTDADVGTKSYTIRECNDGADGFTYDKTVYEVQLTIADNGDGTLTITPDGIPEEGLTFVNEYSEYRDVKATKVWKGDEAQTGTRRDIAVSLYATPSSGETTLVGTQTIPANAEGEALSVVWKDLPVFDEKHMAINYTVEEEMLLAQGEDNRYTTVVTGSANDGFVIINSYASAQAAFTAKKTLGTGELTEGQFLFRLSDENGTLAEVRNAADGSVVFPALTYKHSQLTGVPANEDGSRSKVFTYQITEVNEGKRNCTYDDTVYIGEVTLTLGKDGTLKSATRILTVDGEETEAEFVNYVYDPEVTVSVNFTAKKTLRTGELKDDQFLFRLSSVGDVVAEARNKAEGSITFPELTFEAEWLLDMRPDENGVRTKTVCFDISEVNEGKRGYTYDETVYPAEIILSLSRDGKLTAETRVLDENGEETEALFVNDAYDPETAAAISLTARKALTAGKLEEDQFLFRVTSEGKVVVQARNAADGSITFPEMTFKADELLDLQPDANGSRTKVLIYELSEDAAMHPGFIYDSTVYTVEVTLTLSKDGKLTAESRILNADGQETEALFVNERKTVAFTVTKEWQGGSGPIELTLYCNGEKMDPQPAYDRDGDVYTFSGLPQYDEAGKAYVYSAKERYVDGFIAIYDNVAPYEDETRMIYHGGTIINRKEKTPSLVVTKVWRGLAEGEEAPQITLTLYCNGEKTDVPTPKPNSRGEYRYYDLPTSVNGVPAVYTVVEEPVDGFVTAYRTAAGDPADCAHHGDRIINSRLPKTGDASKPVLWSVLLALSGLVLVNSRKKKPHMKHE